jgi:hypothetical protein
MNQALQAKDNYAQLEYISHLYAPYSKVHKYIVASN